MAQTLYLIKCLSIACGDVSTAVILVNPCQQIRIFVDWIKDLVSHEEQVDVDRHNDVLGFDQWMPE